MPVFFSHGNVPYAIGGAASSLLYAYGMGCYGANGIISALLLVYIPLFIIGLIVSIVFTAKSKKSLGFVLCYIFNVTVSIFCLCQSDYTDTADYTGLTLNILFTLVVVVLYIISSSQPDHKERETLDDCSSGT